MTCCSPRTIVTVLFFSCMILEVSLEAGLRVTPSLGHRATEYLLTEGCVGGELWAIVGVIECRTGVLGYDER